MLINKDKPHKTFRFTRSVVRIETFEIEAMHGAHAIARLRRAIKNETITPISSQVTRIGHLTPEK